MPEHRLRERQRTMRAFILSSLLLQVAVAFVPVNLAPRHRFEYFRQVSYTAEKQEDIAFDEKKSPKSFVDPFTNCDNNVNVFQQSLQEASAIDMDVDQPSVLDNVGAVLAASEQAVLEAEVKLTSDGSMEAIIAASNEAISVAESSLSNNISFTTISEEYAIQKENGQNLNRVSDTVIVESEPYKKIETPSVSKIIRFAIPAIGVWLCGPLLSLIDTGAVGLLGGTVQQAALNPAVAVTDYSALLLSFLFTASTNLVAAAFESENKSIIGAPRTTRTLIGSLQLSAFVGVLLGAATFALAPWSLRRIIGNGSISPAVFNAALKYVRIRSLGVPAASVIGSAQAACLGMQDVRSPLYVLATAAIVNFVGDMMFVGSSHPWIGGAAGAAWATVFSQFAALSLFIHWLCHRPKDEEKPSSVVNVTNAILELTGKPSSPGAGRRKLFRETLRQFSLRKLATIKEHRERLLNHNRLGMITDYFEKLMNRKKKLDSLTMAPIKRESFSVRGFLDGKFQAFDLVRAPDGATIREFAPYAIPVTATVVGRVSGFVAMSHVVSSAMGTASMAAQQVILSFFQCICPIADSLSLTAQSLVPGIVEKPVSQERSRALKAIKINFFKASALFGLAMTAIVSLIPLTSGAFSSDPVVVDLINICVPLMAAWFSMHGVMCAAEGLLLGQKDLNFLGRMYAMWFAIVPCMMLRVKRAALSGCKNANLAAIWQVFLGYQMVRSTLWAIRAALFERKVESVTSMPLSS